MSIQFHGRGGTMENTTRENGPKVPWRMLSILLALVLVAAACGSDGDDEGADDETTTTAEEATATEEQEEEEAEPSAYPVTLTQQLGEVTIEAAPESIVTLDQWSLDFLTELGITPTSSFSFPPFSSWVTSRLDGIEPTPIQGDLPLEAIAAASPDVIFDISGFFTALAPETGATLSEIAPTVSPPVDGLSDTWQARFRHLGAALDRADDVEAIIAETEAALAQANEDFPALAGAAITIARFNTESNTIDLLVDDSDFTRAYMNNELGFSTPAAQVEAFDSGAGEAFGGALQISAEQLELVGQDADAVIMFTTGDLSSLTDQDLWQSLDVVTEDRVVFVDIDTLFAVRTPSPAAVDHVIENLLPELSAAVSGDGASSAAGGPANVVEAAAGAGSTLISNFASFSPTFNDAVTGEGPVTAFLPSDESLSTADPAVTAALQADLALLDTVLQYHAVAGALTAEEVIAAGQIDTLLGESITVTVDGDTVVLNDGQATVAAADLEAPNGIAHVIDGLLIPPSVADQFG
ncbi:MAG: fasciclin domain-containing protein [Actinomycetota bacterium]